MLATSPGVGAEAALEANGVGADAAGCLPAAEVAPKLPLPLPEINDAGADQLWRLACMPSALGGPARPWAMSAASKGSAKQGSKLHSLPHAASLPHLSPGPFLNPFHDRAATRALFGDTCCGGLRCTFWSRVATGSKILAPCDVSLSTPSLTGPICRDWENCPRRRAGHLRREKGPGAP